MSQVDTTAGTFTVLGQVVRIADDTLFDDSLQPAKHRRHKGRRGDRSRRLVECGGRDRRRRGVDLGRRGRAPAGEREGSVAGYNSAHLQHQRAQRELQQREAPRRERSRVPARFSCAARAWRMACSPRRTCACSVRRSARARAFAWIGSSNHLQFRSSTPLASISASCGLNQQLASIIRSTYRDLRDAR